MTDTMMGHNQPDPRPAILDRLTMDYAAVAATVSEHQAAALDMPLVVLTKSGHDAVADLIAKMRGTYKTIEASRVSEKDPYLKSERAVDGYFDPLKDRLKTTADDLTERVQAYLRAKAAEERARREAEAAEERRKEEAALAEQMRRLAAAEEARRRDYKELHESRAAEAAATATDAGTRAAELEASAEVKPAELARTRSDKGTLSTLKSEWTHQTEDIAAVPLDVLRPYIPTETIEKAIRAYVKVGGRQLTGVRIFQTEKAVIR